MWGWLSWQNTFKAHNFWLPVFTTTHLLFCLYFLPKSSRKVQYMQVASLGVIKDWQRNDKLLIIANLHSHKPLEQFWVLLYLAKMTTFFLAVVEWISVKLAQSRESKARQTLSVKVLLKSHQPHHHLCDNRLYELVGIYLVIGFHGMLDAIHHRCCQNGHRQNYPIGPMQSHIFIKL